jgi:hypothetical protein
VIKVSEVMSVVQVIHRKVVEELKERHHKDLQVIRDQRYKDQEENKVLEVVQVQQDQQVHLIQGQVVQQDQQVNKGLKVIKDRLTLVTQVQQDRHLTTKDQKVMRIQDLKVRKVLVDQKVLEVLRESEGREVQQVHHQ